MDWRAIPSLAALRAFEAAARHGSLTGAAAELNVTHAAISQHLRHLSDHFGQPLMIRDGGRMVLTDAGAVLAGGCSAGFAPIAEAARTLGEARHARPISLTTTPSFAEYWLMPRLADLWRRHPDVTLSITPEADLSDLRRDGHDLAIRYGMGEWPGLHCEPLARSGMCAVSHPDLAGQPVGDRVWLLPDTAPEAVEWREARGLLGPNSDRRRLASIAMALAGTRAGAGWTILPHAIVDTDLRSGRLVAVRVPQGLVPGYHLLHRPDSLRPGARKFRAWLLKQAGQSPV